MHILYFLLIPCHIFRIQLKAVISLIMIRQMIVLHQSTAPCKEEEDEGKEQDVVLQLYV